MVTARVGLCATRSPAHAGASAPEQHRGARAPSSAIRDGATRSRSPTCAAASLHAPAPAACVLACWNMMIPYLCPELPAAQKAALHNLVKTPLVYTSVALRNWQLVPEAEVHGVYAPGRLSHLFSASIRRSTSAATAARLAERARSSCTWCARPASPGCPSTSRTTPAAPNCWRPRSRHLSATSAISWRAPSARRLRSRPATSRHHRQPLAAWLCAGIQPPVRSGRARGPAPARRRPRALRPHHHRQFRFRRRRLYRLAIDQAHRAVNELLRGSTV